MKTSHILPISRDTARKIRRIEKTGLWIGNSDIRKQLNLSVNRICTRILDAVERVERSAKKGKVAAR